MSIKINMDKAKEIRKQNLRFQRKPELEKLDVEFQRALEKNDQAEMARIADLKQRLRDITALPELTEASTTDDLNKVTVDSVLK